MRGMVLLYDMGEHMGEHTGSPLRSPQRCDIINIIDSGNHGNGNGVQFKMSRHTVSVTCE
jgi:hypothetical protein